MCMYVVCVYINVNLNKKQNETKGLRRKEN